MSTNAAPAPSQRQDDDLDEDRSDLCCYPSCGRSAIGLYCRLHRRQLAQLGDDDERDDDPPPRDP
jgi:hypothetical protein